MILVSLIFSSTPSFANVSLVKKDSGVESFLETLTDWGSFISRFTGPFDFTKNISIFSKIVRAFNDIIESGDLSPSGFIKFILRQFGVDIFTAPQQHRDKNMPEGTYSI